MSTTPSSSAQALQPSRRRRCCRRAAAAARARPRCTSASRICGTTCSGVTKLMLWQPRSCRSSISSASSCGGHLAAARPSCEVSQFWQKTQRRLQHAEEDRARAVPAAQAVLLAEVREVRRDARLPAHLAGHLPVGQSVHATVARAEAAGTQRGDRLLRTPLQLSAFMERQIRRPAHEGKRSPLARAAQSAPGDRVRQPASLARGLRQGVREPVPIRPSGPPRGPGAPSPRTAARRRRPRCPGWDAPSRAPTGRRRSPPHGRPTHRLRAPGRHW